MHPPTNRITIAGVGHLVPVRQVVVEGSVGGSQAALVLPTGTVAFLLTVGWDSLTPTEVAVVDLVAEGLTNPQIAERLLVGTSTVKTHVHHISTKLAIRTRAELAAAVVANRAGERAR
jgi:DNA-binding NarL/FixJ family response regulator